MSQALGPVALSSFARAFARTILNDLVARSLVLEDALRARLRDTPSTPDPDAESLSAKLNATYRGVPEASAMTGEEIATRIASGEDPFATDLHGRPHRRMSSPPLREMSMALRLLALTPTQDAFERFTAPGVVTTLVIPQRRDRELGWRALSELLHAMRKSSASCGILMSWPETPVFGGEASERNQARKTAEFREAVELAVSKGAAVWALASHADDMPEIGRLLSQATWHLPSLTREMIVEILRVTHSVTGELAEDAVLARLPPDSALAGLHPGLLDHAMAADTTLRVAERLSGIAARADVRPDLTLDDIALPAPLRSGLDRLLADLAAWQSGSLEWSDVSASLFLSGPPGNGKTLLASALAGSARISLITTSYADCQKHGHQGDFLRALSDKVTEAMSRAPAVLLIDELDSFLVRNNATQNSSYNIGVVNGLLEHLSRLNDAPGVLLVGAANNRHLIDPAILRPGRFDQHYEIGPPDQAGIIRILSGSMNDPDRLDLAGHARQLSGCSGATIAAMIRGAKTQARQDGSSLEDHHLVAAIAEIAPKRSGEDLWRIAIHEAGHVVVNWRLTGDIPTRVRITPEGGEVHDSPRKIETAETARMRIAALLAGRAAESVLLDGPSSGAADDLAQATRAAFNLRHSWGLDGKSLLSVHPTLLGRMLPGTELGDALDRIMRDEADFAEHVVRETRDLIEGLAEMLVRSREMERDEIAAFFRVHPVSTHGDSPCP
ncbi:AAA family ATPase [Roseivivax sp. THAF30]|uniref:AAA family ATPase n=1 Tax=Roseivivax sp. THAF30 TaxID=2587852 RepID=UPI0012A85EF7|nr:AAA family ATPase [Roseivivax sp. THAF30]QFT61950.1 ATP-dependent zinc metalloprotease FtsH [Roseivivax sp. THAF30]